MSNLPAPVSPPDIEPGSVVGWFRGVPSLETARLWPEMAAILDPVLKRLAWCYLPSDIQSRLADARMQAFVFEDVTHTIHTVLITEVITYPRSKVLSIIACAGEGFGAWRDFMGNLVGAAREMGCSRIVNFGGRPGWERALAGTGFTKMGTIYDLDIAALDQLMQGVVGHG